MESVMSKREDLQAVARAAARVFKRLFPKGYEDEPETYLRVWWDFVRQEDGHQGVCFDIMGQESWNQMPTIYLDSLGTLSICISVVCDATVKVPVDLTKPEEIALLIVAWASAPLHRVPDFDAIHINNEE
jgi:hypothetical protein